MQLKHTTYQIRIKNHRKGLLLEQSHSNVRSVSAIYTSITSLYTSLRTQKCFNNTVRWAILNIILIP